MKIEEIRQRSKGITGKMPDANKAEIHRRDCVALLSLIDRYEETLRKISVPMPGSRDNELVLYYERIAKQALEKE